MYHFHLTKYWFNKFKDGSKSVEYRIYTERLKKQIDRDLSLNLGWSCARLYCGYPKKGDSRRILEARVRAINFPLFYRLPADVRSFFIMQKNKVEIFDDTICVAFELCEVKNAL